MDGGSFGGGGAERGPTPAQPTPQPTTATNVNYLVHGGGGIAPSGQVIDNSALLLQQEQEQTRQEAARQEALRQERARQEALRQTALNTQAEANQKAREQTGAVINQPVFVSVDKIGNRYVELNQPSSLYYPDPYKGTQFERNHTPTAEEIKTREEEAKNLSIYGSIRNLAAEGYYPMSQKGEVVWVKNTITTTPNNILQLPTQQTTTTTSNSGLLSSVAYWQNVINEDLKHYLTYPIANELSKLGLTNERVSLVGAYSNPLTAIPSFLSPDIRDVFVGFNEGILNDIKENPLKQIELVAGGAVLGGVFRGAEYGLSKLPSVESEFLNLFAELPKGSVIPVGKIASSGLKVAGTTYGAVQGASLIGSTAIGMSNVNPIEAGNILGVTAKDVALLGYGFMEGEKGFDIGKSYIQQAGKTELIVKQGEYPQLPVNKQLEAFQKNIFDDISKNPVAFHTTPEIFYQKGIIEPQVGTSELAGLYASTQVSTPFSKIAGSSSSPINSIEAFQRALAEMFAPYREPGIAALEPRGFREVGYGYSDYPQFEGQKYVKGKGYAFFEEPPKQGVMDLPLMKSEIEAIARIDAGTYEATGQQFYTKIKSVKVPIDVFKATEDQLSKNLNDMYNNIEKNMGRTKETLKPEEYSGYEPPKKSSAISSLESFQQSIQSDISLAQSSLQSSITSSVSGSSRAKSSKSSRSNTSSDISSVSKSISSDISSMQSSLSKSLSSYSNPYNVSTPKSSKSGSSTGYPSSYPPIVSNNYYYQEKQIKTSKKSLGTGYWVYGKALKSSKFFKINQTPLTHNRAKDVGSYYVRQTLARTFRIKKANEQAQEDYEFIGVPEGYYNSVAGKLREYQIKNRKAYGTPEQYIEKAVFSLDTEAEKRQLKEFQRQARNIMKF